jgi:hypothetical protein
MQAIPENYFHVSSNTRTSALQAPLLLGLGGSHFSILNTRHLGRTRLAAKPVARSAWGVLIFLWNLALLGLPWLVAAGNGSEQGWFGRAFARCHSTGFLLVPPLQVFDVFLTSPPPEVLVFLRSSSR